MTSNSLRYFEDKHEGETCYIFGDGPSIRFYDYAKFDRHIAISCSNQIFHRDFNKLRVKYYTLVEPLYFQYRFLFLLNKYRYLQHYKPIQSEFRKLLKENDDIQFFLNLTNVGAIFGPNITFVHRVLIKKYPVFLELMKHGLDPFGGTLSCNLSLALLMGFKKVYLIGFDAFTIHASPYRWYSELSLKNANLPKKVEISTGPIDIYNRYMKIVTITPKGNMCDLENETYLEHTGDVLQYRESSDLIKPSMVGMLRKIYPDSYFKNMHLRAS